MIVVNASSMRNLGRGQNNILSLHSMAYQLQRGVNGNYVMVCTYNRKMISNLR